MRRLILKMSMSLDGFVGGPNGEVDWLMKGFDDAASAWIIEGLWRGGLHIMGSRTYQDMVAYWPSSTEPYAPPMNAIPKVIFSRRGTLAPPGAEPTVHALDDAARLHERTDGAPPDPAILAEWTSSRVASGDIAEEITKLKAEPGKDIIAHGGASFAQSLVATGLIDEYQLIIHPVAIGRGLPLFSKLEKPLELTLVSQTPFPSGAVAHVYRPR
ncbi:dihydrofolate reductase family protein [Kaistia dalseonensis]|uniref:Dihydrofolate reductase n=1 Tax=Kaistia dalseonensis TaxID=410840 RepID=A0ABU0H5P1_9HYPH|nr:dihydrofolate reductase family protein [Kaistia dalseonensis]MCX5495046.1 dihydrofolate reductase family protein [Kaistia dalseonensis]MDQ0437628.1 dihydrofolate reductase [Kaistia dalseonensis]